MGTSILFVLHSQMVGIGLCACACMYVCMRVGGWVGGCAWVGVGQFLVLSLVLRYSSKWPVSTFSVALDP